MRFLRGLALFATIALLNFAGCIHKPAPQKLIYNIPGPDAQLQPTKWELYEHRFPTALTPNQAIPLLQHLGYRFLTPEEEVLAESFIWQQSNILSISLGMIYLEHPIIVFFQPENTDNIYIMGVDEGMFPRPMRGFYENALLGEEYGWLVMRQKPITD